MSRNRASAKKAGTSIASRLWGRVIVTDSLCWEFQGYCRPGGHGQIGIGRALYGAHRVAWALANETTIPAGMVVRHTCDNPPCVNPEHLLLGTPADNVADAVERGRIARGTSLPHTRLSDEQVREVRRRFRRFTIPGKRGAHTNREELAREFGVKPAHITAIYYRRERADVA